MRERTAGDWQVCQRMRGQQTVLSAFFDCILGWVWQEFGCILGADSGMGLARNSVSKLGCEIDAIVDIFCDRFWEGFGYLLGPILGRS